MVNNICAVSGCRKESYPGCGLSFHRLPSDLVLKKKWLEVTPGKLKKSAVVCSLHFTPKDYRTRARRKLKPGVIPSIFRKHDKYDSESDSDDSRDVISYCYSRRDVKDSVEPDAQVRIQVPKKAHSNWKCHTCVGPIEGFRYACVQCVDYDQCAECEASGAHAEHYVLRVPRVERATELQTVLDRVRCELVRVNIPIQMEKGDEEEEVGEAEILVLKTEPVELRGEVDPLQGAGVGAVVGGGAVKQEVIDIEYSDATARGQVPRVSEASSTRTRPGTASNVRTRAGKASGCSAAESRPADTGPGAVGRGAGPGGVAVKQETVDSDDDSLTFDRFQFTEATGVPLRVYEASDVRARAGASRGRAPASEPVDTPAPTEDEGEQPRDSKRQAGASRDVNLNELSTLRFDSMWTPRKRKKTKELKD